MPALQFLGVLLHHEAFLEFECDHGRIMHDQNVGRYVTDGDVKAVNNSLRVTTHNYNFYKTL